MPVAAFNAQVLLALSLLLGCVSLALFVLVDVFKEYRPQFPDVPLLFIALVTMLTATPLAHSSCRLANPQFTFWAPFQGGTTYVVLQGAGWLLYAVGGMLSVTCAYGLHASLIRADGVIVACGGVGFAAVIVIACSVHYYQPQAPVSAAAQADLFPKVGLSREDRLVLILSAAAFSQFVFIDFMKDHGWVHPLTLFAVLGNVVSAVATHVFNGRRRHSEYLLWQPFRGGFKFIIMQAIGWSGFSISLYISIGLVPNQSGHVVLGNIHGVLSLVGLLFFAAQGLLVYSQQYFNAKATDTITPRWSGDLIAFFLQSLGSLVMFVLVDRALAWGVWPHHILSALYTTSATGITMYLAPLLTHYVGGPRQNSSYRFWQPFVGGPKFVFMQCLGWSTYSVSGMIMLLYIFNGLRWVGLWAVATFGFLSELLILLSLPAFQEDVQHVRAPPVQYTLNGEMLVCVILAASGCTLFRLIDLEAQKTGPIGRDIPIDQMLAFAVFTICVATPLGHLSGRRAHPTFRVWQPFSGGAEFVALQAVGWTLFSVMLMFYVIVLLNYQELERMAWEGFLTLCGMVGLVPCVLILISVRLFRASKSHSEERALDVQVAFRHSEQLEGAQAVLQSALHEIQAVLDTTQNELLRQACEQLRQRFAEKLQETKSPAQGPKERAPPTSTSPLTLIGVAISCGSLALHFLADILLHTVPEDLPLIPSSVFCFAFFSAVVAPIITHAFGGPSRYSSYAIWQPFRGGFNFVLLQTIGWALYAGSICLSVIALYSGLGTIAVSGLVSFIGACACASHMVIFLSISRFEPRDEGIAELPASNFLQRNAEAVISVLLTVSAFCLFAVVDVAKERGVMSITPIIVLASVAMFAALPLAFLATHKRGVTEALSPTLARGSSLTDLEGIQTSYVEALGWVAYSVSTALALVCIHYAINRIERMGWLLVYTGGGAIVGSLLIMASVIDRATSRTARQSLLGEIESLCLDVLASTLAFVLYTLHIHILIINIVGCFARPSVGSIYAFVHLLTAPIPMAMGERQIIFRIAMRTVGVYLLLRACWYHQWVDVLWCAVIVRYVGSFNNSHLTGCRTWPAIRNFRPLWDLMARYFRLRLVPIGKLKPGTQYLFGFHPHGVFPLTVVWGGLTSEWRQNYPDVEMHAHGASIMFAIPMLRDVLLWLGCRDVSRKALVYALGHKASPIIVPGGQAEMRESNRTPDTIVLVSKHRGFIKLALEHGTPLVPLVAFGEDTILDNISLPHIQNWFLRHFGFGYPIFPYGRWSLPLPRRTRLTLIVGEPIPVPTIAEPTAADVERLHAKYFAAVKKLFDEQKAAAGYAKIKIVLKDA
eukprot:TRINITY_DN68154_c0_g1_i1.p1 TRINITY_DN68154_c0_g1~~TRINITY_DN68154_c0_g1_i1.p1  ORF type:complete len:1335 (-),score=175.27 TRINITY_DN68154_c0_g1_i1:16-4020(-)